MTFVGLILRNIRSRPLRAALTAAAVAIGVMAVVALGVLTSSLTETATQVLEVGNADFTIAQRHTDDIRCQHHQALFGTGQVPHTGNSGSRPRVGSRPTKAGNVRIVSAGFSKQSRQSVAAPLTQRM